MGRVANKVALVTGAASGIGRATAILLAKEGAAVALTDIADAGQAVADEIGCTGGKASYIRLDVSDEAAWEACIGQVLQTFGKLDIAVNNAGIASARPVAEMTLAEWRRDLSAGSSQEYVEDCPVCCRPNVIHIEVDEDGELRVWAEGE